MEGIDESLQLEGRGILSGPIVLITCPRSGSSMVSGLFHLHGVWVGNCRPGDGRNEKGYFENQDIKKALIKHFGAIVRDGKRVDPTFHDRRAFFLDLVDLKPKIPWLAKHSAMYWKVWEGLSPKYICVKRNIDSTVASNRQTSMLGKKNVRWIVERHHEELDASGGMVVDTDELVAGDDHSLRKAIEYCGLEYKPEITWEFVDKRLWHY